MYESILVPTDGSDTAERATDHAIELTEAFDATLHVLSVVDVDTEAGPFSAGGVDDEFMDRLQADAEAAVASVVDAVPGHPVETEVVEGSPAETIVDYATSEGVDLVVMGTHGRTGLDRVVTGSTSAKVVRESPAPVISVRDANGSSSIEYGDVLIPTDGSPAAEAAIDHGIAVADAFDATVHAVYVVDTMALSGGADTAVPGGGGGGGAATGDLLEPLISSGEDATDRIAKRASQRGLDATTEVIEGSPGSALVEYVETEPVDFVAMGTHGRTGLDRVLLGSTTERMMRHSDAPVLSVRHEETE